MTVFLSFILDEDVQSRFENWRTGRVGLQEIYSTRSWLLYSSIHTASYTSLSWSVPSFRIPWVRITLWKYNFLHTKQEWFSKWKDLKQADHNSVC